MASRAQGRALFAFPFPYADRKPSALNAVKSKKRKAPSTSEADPSENESEGAVDGNDLDYSKSKDGRTVRANVRKELAELKPPLFPPFLRSGRRIDLKQQHISVLTAIMHRCVQEGDFARAGRAFGLLLRTDYNGQNFDLRSRGLYGVGAEVLLNQKSEFGDPSEKRLRPERVASRSTGYVGLSRQNFEAAKAYYERLSIDYPFRPVSSTLVSSLDFYPIMYGLWISFVQDQYQDALEMASSPTENTRLPILSGTGSAVEMEIARETKHALEEVAAIETSLKELMMTPPYSESAYLQGVRSMIQRWIKDLGQRIPTA